MEHEDYAPLPSDEEIDKFSAKLSWCLPLLFLSILPYFAIYYALVAPALDWTIFLWGAGGWWLALILRIPFVLGAKATVSGKQLQTMSILISGPAEETIRVAMLFTFGWAAHFDETFALGLGWTSLELLFTAVQSFSVVQLLRAAKQGDANAVEAFHSLAAQSGRSDPLSVHPAWGILERCSAHAIHISMSVFGAMSPWMLLATLSVHSAINWSTVTLMPKLGPFVVELALFAVSMSLLIAAPLAWQMW
mmetsp:Transcript_3137/g.7309  ORF Transcript_3137/g.7309 Transcript_3137/m.7309 type:complete len:249 (-) Transcript_3137:41-787(-)